MEASSLPRAGALALPRSRRLLSALDDGRLVAQLRRGNEAAFEVLYDRHHRGILAYCRHTLGSREEAEDALQQVFASAYDDLLAHAREVRLKPWLYTIARNRCLSVLRARREQPAELGEVATEGLSGQVEHRAELRQLLADLRELPEPQRAALVMSEVADLGHADIAQVLGCEAAKVKSLVFQARSGLIERRQARETPCEEIRQQLATLRGGALRRGPLRRHLKACPACAEYREAVKRQRRMLAVALPVAPSLGLRESVLAAVGLGGGGAAAGAVGGGAGGAASGVLGSIGGALSGGGGGVAGAVGSLAAKAGVAKVVVAVAASGAAAGGGAAVVIAGGGETAAERAPATSSGPGNAPASGAPPGFEPLQLRDGGGAAEPARRGRGGPEGGRPARAERAREGGRRAAGAPGSADRAGRGRSTRSAAQGRRRGAGAPGSRRAPAAAERRGRPAEPRGRAPEGAPGRKEPRPRRESRGQGERPALPPAAGGGGASQGTDARPEATPVAPRPEGTIPPSSGG